MSLAEGGWAVLGWALSAPRSRLPGRGGIPEFQNGWGWKQPLPRWGHPEQVTEGHIQVGLEWFRRGGQWHGLGGTMECP